MSATAKPDEIPTPELSAVEAQLFVADIKASCDWFTGKLGFTVVFTYGEPPFYGQVRRDNALINLRMVCEPVFVGDIREREQLLGASMTVDSAAEIRQLFLDWQAAGVEFFQPLKQEPWGGRSFIVRDPDGKPAAVRRAGAVAAAALERAADDQLGDDTIRGGHGEPAGLHPRFPPPGARGE